MAELAGRAPWHLWLVGTVAILFNAVGVFDWVMSMAQGERYMESAGMTPAQIAHYRAMPPWMDATWAIGVWSAIAASALLLLRNRWAAPVFALSIAAFLVSQAYTYILTDGGAIMGREMATASIVITALLVTFLSYATAMRRRGVLR